MKIKGAFTQDGFKGNIELLQHQRETENGIIEAITSMVGTDPCFIKGGLVSQANGNTTITSGLIAKDNKLYHFTGGTYAGTPASLKILFEEKLAAGYPQSYFVGDPIGKEIYLDRTAKVDAAGTTFISAVDSIYTMQSAKPILDSVANKAVKYAYIDISNEITIAPGFTLYDQLVVRKYDDGTIFIKAWILFSGAKTAGTAILNNLPANPHIGRLSPVILSDNNNNSTVGHIQISGSSLAVFNGFDSSRTTAIINTEFKIN